MTSLGESWTQRMSRWEEERERARSRVRAVPVPPSHSRGGQGPVRRALSHRGSVATLTRDMSPSARMAVSDMLVGDAGGGGEGEGGGGTPPKRWQGVGEKGAMKVSDLDRFAPDSPANGSDSVVKRGRGVGGRVSDLQRLREAWRKSRGGRGLARSDGGQENFVSRRAWGNARLSSDRYDLRAFSV